MLRSPPIRFLTQRAALRRPVALLPSRLVHTEPEPQSKQSYNPWSDQFKGSDRSRTFLHAITYAVILSGSAALLEKIFVRTFSRLLDPISS